MCGILVQISEFKKDEARFLNALNLQEHRGPDDFGTLEVDNHLFGHRRLSIIDLAHSAAQPMQSIDENITIVFNGEIYNFNELRNTLIEKGYIFRTNGDTEVLINLYKEYGISFLELLIGMFAFVLKDNVNNKTYVIRDRLGIKPLFFSQTGQELIFSSEIKSILYLLDNKPEINEVAVSSYFSFRYPILNDSFYKGINAVEPGCFLCIEGNQVTKSTYWNLAELLEQQDDDKGEAYYQNKLISLLKSSVEYRQIADVKVGAYLSGGVDSSAIVALMSENSKVNVPTFTIGFNEEGYNEFEYAKEVAEQYQTEHHEITISDEDYFSTMEELIAFKDAPLGVPNEVPLYLMSKELKKYITVVLSGEGADEIFAGYGRIFRSAFEYNKSVEVNQKVTKTADEKLFLAKLKKKYGRSYFESELEHFYTIYSYTPETLKDEILTSLAHNKKITAALKERFQCLFDELPKDTTYVNKMMYVFEKVHLVGLLQRVDMTTMAISVEARVPFVDHRLVEFAFTVPVKYKLKWANETINEDNLLTSEEISETHDIPKYILKKSMENHLSDNILYRKKMGFPVPLNKWFGGDFSEKFLQILTNNPEKIEQYVNIPNVTNIVKNSDLENDHSLSLKMWMILNLQLFCRN